MSFMFATKDGALLYLQGFDDENRIGRVFVRELC
jgi:hypothetical protein